MCAWQNVLHSTQRQQPNAVTSTLPCVCVCCGCREPATNLADNLLRDFEQRWWGAVKKVRLRRAQVDAFLPAVLMTFGRRLLICPVLLLLQCAPLWHVLCHHR